MHERRVFQRYLTPQEESQLFRTVSQFGTLKAKRDYAWMMLIRQTGIRVEPLSLLTVEDAESALRTGALRIRGEINKGGKEYSVFLNKTAQSMLRRLLHIRRRQGYSDDLSAPLIMSRNHRGISKRTLQDAMTQWVQCAGLTVKATPHWLRHTFAKRILARSTAREPLPVAQHALGHSDINSTAIYSYPDRGELEAALQAIG